MSSEPSESASARTFAADGRARIRAAYAADEPLVCPKCAIPLDRRDVPPKPDVSYVRHRLVVTCPSCRGHLVLDRSERR